jgi:hypothetical protein
MHLHRGFLIEPALKRRLSRRRCTSPSFLKAGQQQHLRLPLFGLFHEALLDALPSSKSLVMQRYSGGRQPGPACQGPRFVSSSSIGFTEVGCLCCPLQVWSLPGRSSSLSLAAHVGNEVPSEVQQAGRNIDAGEPNCSKTIQIQGNIGKASSVLI